MAIAALQIPSSVLKPRERPGRETEAYGIAALQIPSSVLKRNFEICENTAFFIAALQIPSSVLKLEGYDAIKVCHGDCSPPNTVIGIETEAPEEIA